MEVGAERVLTLILAARCTTEDPVDAAAALIAAAATVLGEAVDPSEVPLALAALAAPWGRRT